MPDKEPLAFLSYAHSDDEYENGRLRQFAERLRGEVRLQWGSEFPIFIERSDVKWGQQWRLRIEKSLDEVTFLIPLLTPGYFKSEYCRKELERFLEREKQLNRADLILPVYYVRCPILEDSAKRQADELAMLLSDRQYKDWRHLRLEPWTSPDIGRQFERMALEIVEALERGGEAPTAPPVAVKRKPSSAEGNTGSKSAEKPKDSAKSPSPELPTVSVDAMNRGNFTTISAAINIVPAGTRILVRPGTYRENIVIDKTVEIVGEGNAEDIVVQSAGGDVIKFSAPMGRVANLSLRQVGAGDYFAVKISSGRLDLEDCDISSQSLSGVVIHGGSDPRLRRNRIHGCKQHGIFVYDNSAGVIEDNDVFDNLFANIGISNGANPTVRRNRIRDGKVSGIRVSESGAGLIEDNEISGNEYSGIQIQSGANPTVRRNRIHDGKTDGILMLQNGAALVEDNDIVGNKYSGIEVKEGANPTVRNNRIKGNREGVRVLEGGAGTFEGNEFSGNKSGAWLIAADCEASVKRSGNVES